MSTRESKSDAFFQRATKLAVESGSLISIQEMSERLHASRVQIRQMLRRGELFSFDLNREPYIPLLLAPEPEIRDRLWSVCRILYPAPADARLEFLVGSLEDPDHICNIIAMLETDSGYEYARRRAKQWAAEWSRTAISMFAGTQDCFPYDEAPLYEALVEVDPRISSWARALTAMTEGVQEGSDKPAIGTTTLFVSTIAPPDFRTVESQIVLTLADRREAMSIQIDDDRAYLFPLPSCFDTHSAGSIAWHVCHHLAHGGRAAGLSIDDTAQMLSLNASEVKRLVDDGSLARVSGKHRTLAVTLESVRAYRIAAYLRTQRELAGMAHFM